MEVHSWWPVSCGPKRLIFRMLWTNQRALIALRHAKPSLIMIRKSNSLAGLATNAREDIQSCGTVSSDKKIT